MTREAVSAAKPAVRAQAKTEKVHGAASAAVLKGLVYGAAVLTFAVLLFLIGYIRQTVSAIAGAGRAARPVHRRVPE